MTSDDMTDTLAGQEQAKGESEKGRGGSEGEEVVELIIRLLVQIRQADARYPTACLPDPGMASLLLPQYLASLFYRCCLSSIISQ